MVRKIKSDGITETSDKRFKENIVIIDGALAKVMSLRGVYFNWKPEFNEDCTLQIGVIAQEIEKVIPQVVDTDTEGYKSVEYAKLVAVLIEAIKEQESVIQAQKAILTLQQTQLSAVQTDLNNLKTEVGRLLQESTAVNNR